MRIAATHLPAHAEPLPRGLGEIAPQAANDPENRSPVPAAVSPPAPKAEAAPAPPDLLQLPPPDERPDVRSMSPRRLAEFAHELYMEGVIGWEEFRMLGSPSELHPDFDKTIGGLTGERADPDRPRDMVAVWKQRLEFEIAHSAANPEIIERTERILNVLRWQDVPGIRIQV